MSLLIKITTAQMSVVGDGASTVLKLSLAEYPFPEKPPGRVTNVEFGNHPFDGDSLVFDTKQVTVTFEQSFTGEVALTLKPSYDPT